MEKDLAQIQQAIVSEFSDLTDWEERYAHIIELGRDLDDLPEPLKDDKHKVQGCQSQVWLHAELDAQNRIVFRADSDAMIVRGLIALLLRVYSDATPEQILNSPPQFIAESGLNQHLSPTRSNGLKSMVEQMMYYATAFQTILAHRASP